MASAEAVPDPSPDAEVYAAHWGRVYETDESARTREWHCDFADCRAFIAPYCARAGDAGDGTVLDVGCGGSSFGDELRSAFGLERLVLTDIDPGIVRILRERHAARRRDDGKKKGAKTTCLVADCTSMPAIADDSVDVVVDKGTLDALHGEEDKLKMMRECARVVKKNAGVVVSVSFASAARAEFLRRVADELRLDLKLAVIGGGDPKFGNLVHFVSVLGFHLKKNVPEFSQPDDELTRTVARRVARARSVIEDEPPSADDALTLFDASDAEDEAG